MIAAGRVLAQADAGRHAARQRDDVLACAADLGADHVGVGVRPEVPGGQRALQGHRTTGVGAGDDGGRGLFLGDLAGQVGPGDDGHPDGSAPVTWTTTWLIRINVSSSMPLARLTSVTSSPSRPASR